MELPIIILSLFILLDTFYMFKAEEERPCNITIRCSTVEDPVWAIDGESCRVFRNRCFLLTENCNRQNEHKKQLKETTKDKCQSLCSSFCQDDNVSVCGYYKEKKQTFANQCEMDNHICITGQTYDIYGLGPCE